MADQGQNEGGLGLPVIKINGLKETNEKAHFTAKYESTGLFLRRGQTFKISIDLERGFREDEDRFSIQFETGKRPQRRNRTLVTVEKVEQFEKIEWGYKILKSGTTLEVEVNIPADCIVSKYEMTVVAMYKFKTKKKTVSYVYKEPVYILYNAWCKEDEVFMSDEEKRQEYVLNDTGCVYWAAKRAKPWFFGQFANATFSCVMSLLERVSINHRDTAREVARAISALANDSDENGVLTGNWSGDYDTGVKPWKWVGSPAIFKKYMESGSPVHYGQCWVFSGITTSLMRALGIPTRSVTNYDSAHDTDSNITFDKYFDENGDYQDDISDDSCWNFHVWNESWMARPDLPLGYGGWQAFDSTPQELSKGKFRAGPASLRAIKEGKVNLNYDTKFIFAEVNADKVYWVYNPKEDKYEPLRIDKDAIGRDISTKEVGFFGGREDITSEYKYREGSALERVAVRRAMKIAKSEALKKYPEDIKFSIDCPEDITRGEDVVVVVKMENTSAKVLAVDVSLTSQIVRYTGVALKKLAVKRAHVEIAAKKSSEENFIFSPAEYAAFMDESPMLRFSLMAKVETGQIHVQQALVSIDKPTLNVSLASGAENGKVKAGSSVRVKVELDLPADVKKLSNCVLSFDGSAVTSPVEFKIKDVTKRKLGVEQSISIREDIKDRKEVQLIAELSSKEITGLQGALSFQLAQ